MLLITTFIMAILVTLFWLFLKKKYKLGFLSLMLWGATIMILVDYILGYEGGNFLEIETDGMIQNGTLLGIVMLVPVLFTWLIMIFVASSATCRRGTVSKYKSK